MLWAEGDGTIAGIIAAFVAAFGGLAGLVGWLVRMVFTQTIPNLTTTFQASLDKIVEQYAQSDREQRELFDQRQVALLEHCEREADKERQISEQRYLQAERRFSTAMDALKEIQQSVLNQNAIQSQLLSLTRQRTRLSDVVESAEDAIWSKSLEGFVTSWNHSTERLLGWRAGEMIGQSVYRVIPPDLHEQEREMLAKLARGERVDRYETERFHRDGRRMRLSVTASAIKDPTGRPIGVSTIAREL